MSERSEKMIKLWPGSTANRTLRDIGVSREEMATMRKVLREKEGKDVPWFHGYCIKKGLID